METQKIQKLYVDNRGEYYKIENLELRHEPDCEIKEIDLTKLPYFKNYYHVEDDKQFAAYLKTALKRWEMALEATEKQKWYKHIKYNLTQFKNYLTLYGDENDNHEGAIFRDNVKAGEILAILPYLSPDWYFIIKHTTIKQHIVDDGFGDVGHEIGKDWEPELLWFNNFNDYINALKKLNFKSCNKLFEHIWENSYLILDK